jgi:small subunit ribosomal protein S8
MLTDPIADMLTRIRNANKIGAKEVEIPYSQLKEGIAKKLHQEGFVLNYRIQEANPGNKIMVSLKYGPDSEKVIQKIQRVSRPGRRVYTRLLGMKKVLGGLGISIVSTSRGVLTDRECHEQKVGGEILCTVC